MGAKLEALPSTVEVSQDVISVSQFHIATLKKMGMFSSKNDTFLEAME